MQVGVQDDLGAVGAVGVPGAVGLSLDAEAVMHLGVVALAEQRAVLDRGRPVVQDPFQNMVDVTPVGGGPAASITGCTIQKP